MTTQPLSTGTINVYPLIDQCCEVCYLHTTPVNRYALSVYPLIDQRIRHPGNFQLLLDILGFRHFEVRHSGTHPRRLGALRVRMTSLTRFAHAR